MFAVSINFEKAIASIYYLVSKTSKGIDIHKLLKLLYFAEQKHLVDYGRTIIGDSYKKLPYGPVPQVIYDQLKELRNNSSVSFTPFVNYFESRLKDSKPVIFRKICDNVEMLYENLSESEIECLDFSFNNYFEKSFRELTNISHDIAWTNTSNCNYIDWIDVAKAGGADQDTIQYIKTNIEDTYLIEEVYG